jgi:beta-phosphoglucomutase-like phosphatase (HAD superfamily)
MKWDAVFWDFDGVVLDSVHVKTRAFSKMFSQYGQAVEKAVIDYHLTNGGVSRYEKFKYYYRVLLKKKLPGAELEALGAEFSKLALEEVLNSPFICGALETLKDLKKREVPCFVASGTPDDEIKKIIAKRNLSNYFQEVHGSPALKDQILRCVIAKYDYLPSNCVFLGDAMTDYIAAQKVGIRFIGVCEKKTTSPFPTGTLVTSEVKVF